MNEYIKDKNLFLKFDSQEKRKSYGGSCFIELQFCKLPPRTKIKQIMKGFKYWEDDSLYIYEIRQEDVYLIYKDIIGYGLHMDFSEGYFDTWGVTYYEPGRIENIKERLMEQKPEESEILLEWLEKAEKYNGFYVLGV